MNTKSTKKFVLVREDKSLVTSNRYRTEFKQKAAAERMAWRLRTESRANGGSERIAAMEYSEYINRGYDRLTRKVTNVMTGAIVEENINTPYSCSVASEAYWSM